MERDIWSAQLVVRSRDFKLTHPTAPLVEFWSTPAGGSSYKGVGAWNVRECERSQI